MHADAAEEFNTSSATRDTAKNTTSGALAQKWPTRMLSTDGKTRTGQRSDPPSIFLAGRGVSLTTQTHDIMTTRTPTHAPLHTSDTHNPHVGNTYATGDTRRR